MDIRMPNLDGIEATRLLAAQADAPRVLILTTFDLDEYVYEALRAGASGFLLKDAGADELLHAVRVVADGEALLSPSITRRLIADYARRPPPSEQPAALAELTPRELEVLRLLARGFSNGDRARARARRGDREDARRPRLPEARPARPGASGRARLRDRARHPRRSRIAEHVACVRPDRQVSLGSHCGDNQHQVTTMSGTAASGVAAAHLYERYGNQIYRYCLGRLRDREDAADAAQNTFLRVHLALEKGVVPRYEASWLYKIAHNVCLSWIESSGRRALVETPRDLDSLDEAVLAGPASEHEAVEDLAEALAA